jgi:uncharacterized protein YoxC
MIFWALSILLAAAWLAIVALILALREAQEGLEAQEKRIARLEEAVRGVRPETADWSKALKKRLYTIEKKLGMRT